MSSRVLGIAIAPPIPLCSHLTMNHVHSALKAAASLVQYGTEQSCLPYFGSKWRCASMTRLKREGQALSKAMLDQSGKDHPAKKDEHLRLQQGGCGL